LKLSAVVSIHALALLTAVPAINAQTNQPLRLTVAPKSPSQILMTTLPNAACVLHAKGAADSKQSLKLFANEEGSLRFNVVPSAESENAADLEVDCKSAVQAAKFSLQLRPSFSPTADMPTPSAEVVQPNPQAYIRPSLTQADALQLSAAELAGKGYPVRPNEQESPKAFATWMRAVTQPSTYVPAKLVTRLDMTHVRQPVSGGFETLSNWSGYELRGGAGSYVAVQGMWNVPTVAYEANQHVYSAYWIGLDGDGTNDLVQAGTEQEITEINFLGFNLTFTNYYAWTEFLPQQPTEQVISNFTVNPGDEISCSVSMGGSFFIPVLSGPDGIFIIDNVTRGEYTSVATPRGSTSVGGSEAEWIMERPTVNNALPDLANYGVAYMWNASALSAKTYNWVNYSAAANQQIFMYNGSDLLSGAYYLTPSEMFFLWFKFH
jgi:hypothetical protein